MKIINNLFGKKYIKNLDKCIYICDEIIQSIKQFKCDLHQDGESNGYK